MAFDPSLTWLRFESDFVASIIMNSRAVPPDYALLIHALAALAYRTQKAVRGAEASYAALEVGHGVRSPHLLVKHMEGVIGYATTFFDPIERPFEPVLRSTFAEQLTAFHDRLDELGSRLRHGSPMYRELTPARLLQGPIADAITHAGQLALLRRFIDDPVPSENFIFADISPDNLSPIQPPPVRPGRKI